MQIERDQGIENFQFFSDELVGRIVREREIEPSTSFNVLSFPSGVNYIEHRVSRMDTLAGIAIKKSSPEIDVLTSLQSHKVKSSQRGVSSAMSSLQGYYGLTPSCKKGAAEGTEMAIYTRGTAQCLEDALQHKTSPSYDPHPSQHRRSRSLANGFPLENGGLAEDVLSGSEAQKSNEKLERTRTLELLLKDDNSSCFSGITGKSLALRPKSVNRAAPSADRDSGHMNPIPMGSTFMCEGFSGFRKSLSTSNLQDPENSTSIWPTSKMTKRSDTGSSTRPTFDGLPKPVTIRRNKAALD